MDKGTFRYKIFFMLVILVVLASACENTDSLLFVNQIPDQVWLPGSTNQIVLSNSSFTKDINFPYVQINGTDISYKYLYGIIVDDFNNLNQWNSLKGSFVSNGIQLVHNSDAMSLIELKNHTISDGVINVQAMSATSALNHNFGVAFGIKDSNNYLECLARVGAGDWKIRNISGGSATDLLINTSNKPLKDTLYNMTVRIDNGKIDCIANGIVVASVDLGGSPLGGVGLSAYNTESYFDNFELQSLVDINVNMNNNLDTAIFNIPSGFNGTRYVKFFGNDGSMITSSNLIKILVYNYSSDNQDPTVNLTTPSNGSILSGSLINLTFDVKDDMASNLNCTLLGSINGANQNYALGYLPDGTLKSIEATNLTEGVYIWNVQCVDDNGNIGKASLDYTFFVNISTPIFNQNLTDQQINQPDTFAYDINCSDLESNITYFDNSTEWDIDPLTGMINYAYDPSQIGNYSYAITCSDSVSDVTQTFNLEIYGLCGDAAIQPIIGEGCDDGNNASGDGCSDLCIIEYCGDWIINDVNETCDDGNNISDDGCSSSCAVEYCGDGLINNNGTESCDDGNNITTDSCNSCALTYCGDGTLQVPNWFGQIEACDDNNNVSGDGCSNICVVEVCGDGIVNVFNETCDDGNSINDDACKNNCLINEPPTRLGGGSITGFIHYQNILEDSIYRIYNFSTLFNDINNDPLYFQVISQDPTKVTCVYNNINDRVIMTAVNDYNGPALCVVEIADGFYQENYTINISVLPVNDPPTFTDSTQITGYVDYQVIPEDLTRNINGFSTQFVDIDGDTLAFSVISENDAQVDCWYDIANDRIRMRGMNNYVGPALCIVGISDGIFIENYTINITVTPRNDPPTFLDGSTIDGYVYNQTIPEDLRKTLVNFSTKFVDIDGDVLNFSVVYENSSQVDCWYNPTNDRFIMDALNNYNGPALCIVEISDGSIAQNYTINITVTPVNDAPTFIDLSQITGYVYNQTIPENNIRNINAFSALFTDIDGDMLNFSTIVYEDDTQVDCWYDIVNDRIRMRALNDYNGPALCIVGISDGIDTVNYTINITVTPINDAPIINFTGYNPKMDEDSLAWRNISLWYSDIDNTNGELTYNCSSNNTNVTLFITPVNNLRFNASDNFNGDVLITCTIFDLEPLNDTDNFTLTVLPVNDAPVVNLSFWNGLLIPQYNYWDTINLSQSVFDIDNLDSEINWTCYSDEPLLTIEVNNTTKFLNITTNNFYGIANITCIASDLEPLFGNDTFWINVSYIGRPPVFDQNLTNYTVFEDDLFILDVNCSDPDGDNVTYSDNSPVWDIDNQTGMILHYFNNSDACVGTYIYTVSCSDGFSTVSQTFNVTVINTNDPPVIDFTNVTPSTVIEDTANTTINLDDYVTDEDMECLFEDISWSCRVINNDDVFVSITTGNQTTSTVIDLFDNISSTWTIEKGAFTNPNGSLVHNSSSTSLIRLNNQTITDGTIEVTAKAGTTQTSQNFAVAFGITGPNDYYECLGRVGAGDWKIRQIVSGVATDLFVVPANPPLVDINYAMTVDITGNNVDCLANGVSVISGAIPGYVGGKVGLASYATESVYDDFSVQTTSGFPGGDLLINATNDWYGNVTIRCTASDGISSDTEMFTIKVINDGVDDYVSVLDDTYADLGTPNIVQGLQSDMFTNPQPLDLQRIFIKFDLSIIPDFSTISSATLRLCRDDTPDGRVLDVYDVDGNSWEEETLTWNNMPSYSTYISTTLVDGGTQQDCVWYDFDVTQIIETDMASGLDMTSMLIKDKFEGAGQNGPVRFVTRNHFDVTKHPKLFIVYDSNVNVSTPNTNVPVVTLTAPVNDSTVNVNTINLSYLVTDIESPALDCNLYVNVGGVMGVQDTHYNVLNGTTDNFVITLPDGNYLWNVKCTDDGFNSSFAPLNWSFTIQTSIPPPPPVAGNTTLLYSTKDSYTKQSQPNNNFGNVNTFQESGELNNLRRGFIQFDLSGLTGVVPNVASAQLRLCRDISTGSVHDVSIYHVFDDTWSESTLNWNNQPFVNVTNLVANQFIFSGSACEFFTFDITAHINAEIAAGNTATSLAVLNGNEGSSTGTFMFRSKEYTGTMYDPMINVTY